MKYPYPIAYSVKNSAYRLSIEVDRTVCVLCGIKTEQYLFFCILLGRNSVGEVFSAEPADPVGLDILCKFASDKTAENEKLDNAEGIIADVVPSPVMNCNDPLCLNCQPGLLGSFFFGICADGHIAVAPAAGK